MFLQDAKFAPDYVQEATSATESHTSANQVLVMSRALPVYAIGS